MEINREINGMGQFSMPVCRRTVNSDITEDFTLPDYYPEIRRVLCIRENLLPPSKFVNGSKLDISGVMDYTLVYLSYDGKLSSAPLSAEYNSSVNLEGMNEFESGEGICVLAHSMCEGSNVRVVSPRKLQVRSKIKTNVNAYGKKLCMESLEGVENEASIEYLKGEDTNVDVFCETSDLITLEDEYILGGENARVAEAEGQVFVESTDVDGEMIRLGGYALLKLLVCSENNCEKVVRRIPFDAECELDGAVIDDAGMIRADGFVSDISVNIEEGKAATEMNIILEICIAQNKKVGYTKDCYSTEQKSQCIFENESVPTVVQNRVFNFGVSERISKEEAAFPENFEIVDIFAAPIFEKVEYENGKYIMQGNCKYSIICSNDGEYSVCEIKLPFKYQCEGSEELAAYDVSVYPLSCRGRTEGEYLSIESEMAGAATLMSEHETKVLKKAVFSDKAEDADTRFRVCYIQSGEGLWDIAKRYAVKESCIKGDAAKDRFILIEG